MTGWTPEKEAAVAKAMCIWFAVLACVQVALGL